MITSVFQQIAASSPQSVPGPARPTHVPGRLRNTPPSQPQNTPPRKLLYLTRRLCGTWCHVVLHGVTSTRLVLSTTTCWGPSG